MNRNPEIYYKRLGDFSGPIQDLSRDNPVIYRVICAYASGEIITREEALSQMVVMLAKDWTEQHKRLFDLCMNLPLQVKL
jgi:hypothetical protein